MHFKFVSASYFVNNRDFHEALNTNENKRPSGSSVSPWLIGSPSPLQAPPPPAPPPSVGPLESSALPPPWLLSPSAPPWVTIMADAWVPSISFFYLVLHGSSCIHPGSFLRHHHLGLCWSSSSLSFDHLLNLLLSLCANLSPSLRCLLPSLWRGVAPSGKVANCITSWTFVFVFISSLMFSDLVSLSPWFYHCVQVCLVNYPHLRSPYKLYSVQCFFVRSRLR